MEKDIESYLSYLCKEKNISANTCDAYQRDLRRFMEHLKSYGITKVSQIGETDLRLYLECLKAKELKPSTIARNVVSIRKFLRFAQERGQMEHMEMADEDITEGLKAVEIPKSVKTLPEILTEQEVNVLLAQTAGDSPKRMRDRAMLELLYATGIKVTELISLRIYDVDMRTNTILCGEAGKERRIPFGRDAKIALTRYLTEVRADWEVADDRLFPNCSGQPMSRQGFWKLLKAYGKKAGIEKEITPHTLRHTFAAHMLQNGAELKSVQKMLGHADISTTQMYQQLGHSPLREMYNRTHPKG